MKREHLSKPVRVVGRTLILVAVVAAPWFFGAVQAKVQVGLYATALGAVALSILELVVTRKWTIRVPLLLLPLLGALLIDAFQLVPISRSARSLLSPMGVELTDSLRDKPVESWVAELGIDTASARQPVSLYPGSSRHDLALLILAVSVFFAGFVLFHRSEAFFWLFSVIAANGAAIAFFGMVQRLSWNGLLYWTVPLLQGGQPFGPFVNRNNAGGYLLVCLGAAISLSVWSVHRFFSGADMWARYSRHDSQRWVGRTKGRVHFVLANLNATVLTVFAGTGLIVTGILATLSRGAIVAMVVAMAATLVVVLVLRKHRGMVAWLVVTVTLGLLLLTWIGLGQQVRQRLATLLDSRTTEMGRLPHWQLGLEAAKDFQRLGSGLGTYRFIYPRYQKKPVGVWYYHAENQYLEALVEQGIVGLALLLTALLFAVRDAWTLQKRGRDILTLSFAVGSMFAIIGQMVSASFDFGLYIPSNTILFALIVGAIAGRAADLQAEQRTRRPGGWLWGRASLILVGGVLLLSGIWGIERIRGTAFVEAALSQMRRDDVLANFDIPTLTRDLKQLQLAVQRQSDNAELRRELAKLRVQLYRAETLASLRKKTALPADDPSLQRLTSILLLHQRLHFLSRAGLATQLVQTRSLPSVRRELVPALKQFLRSRGDCPLLPAVHCGIAQLCGIVTEPNSDKLSIRRTRQLAPSDPDLLFICGVLDYSAGRVSAALGAWKASLTCSLKHLDDVVVIVGKTLAKQSVVAAVLPDSPSVLVNLVQNKFLDPMHARIRKALLARAWQLLDQVNLPAAERSYWRAQIAAMRGATRLANDSYLEAVRGRPDQLTWRYDYARFLRKQGNLEAAIDQILMCVRMEPFNENYRSLLESMQEEQLRGNSKKHRQ